MTNISGTAWDHMDKIVRDFGISPNLIDEPDPERGGTLIATFDEYGEVLAWVIAPPSEWIRHGSEETDPIRTYHTDVEDYEDFDEIQGALDLLAQVHAIDAKHRTRSLTTIEKEEA